MMRRALALTALLLLLAGPAVAWDGEEVGQVDGFPAMWKFAGGDPQRPLVVFIPGAHHTARIAYGGQPGGLEQDFLAHWLVQLGYNFVGVSYPIATRVPVMSGTFPAYTARDWGLQAADIARQAIAAHHLTNRIIVIGWSMGGRSAEPVAEAAQAAGLEVAMFLSFSSTPGITGLVDMNAQFKMTPAGYADRTNIYPGFWRQIELENAMTGHTIIDQQTYLSEIVGDMPVDLEGYGLHYRDGTFVRDYWADESEFRAYEFGKLPRMAMLMPNETLDARHALTDRGNWGLMIVNRIAARIDARKVELGKLPRAQWLALVDTVRQAPDRLSMEMNGDHFFFLGETGARETARAVQTMEARVAGFETQVEALLVPR